jgi:hypothetical protein
VAEEVLAMGYFMWNWKNNKVCLLGGVWLWFPHAIYIFSLFTMYRVVNYV